MVFHLKDNLKVMGTKILSNHSGFFEPASAYHEPTMVKVSATICAALGDIEPKDPKLEELKDVYDGIIKYYRENNGFIGISKRIIRKCPWVVFEGIDSNRPPLGEIKNLNVDLYKHIGKSGDSRAILSLAFVFLRIYPQKKIYFEKIRDFIALIVSKQTTLRGQRFAQQSQNYKLFTAEGPGKVASTIINIKQPISDTLTDCGLYGGCQQEGFIEEVFVQWINGISLSLKRAEYYKVDVSLQQLLDFSVTKNSLRFPNKRIDLIEGMLLPFQINDPVPECKKYLRDFLLQHFGDPRFDKGSWGGVKDSALQIMFGWLTEIVLEDFFRLLDYSAKYDRDADRQWRYRKAFWSACLRNGLISKAWVALGRRVASNAVHFLDGKKNVYAEISGAGVQGHHAVLIMQMNNMIVTEWSHSGKYRFWHESRYGCPKLYQPSYDRDDVITQPDFEGSHYSAQRGGWQTNVADYIRGQTGFNLPYKEYMRL